MAGIIQAMILPVFFCKVDQFREVGKQRVKDTKYLTKKTLKYTTKYPNSGLNLGLGWNWIDEESGFSGGIYFVGVIGGGPQHTYVSDTGYTCSDNCKASWEDNINENMRTSALMINLGYNFSL